MNLRDNVFERWWPATQSLDLVEGSTSDVAAAVQHEVNRFVNGERLNVSWLNCPELDSVFSLVDEFANVPTTYIVLPTRSKWSVLWNDCY